MTSLREKILNAITGSQEGAPLTTKGFLHLGTRAAVDQVLSRLSRSGQLQRVSRGLYVQRVMTRFGERAPALEAVLGHLAEQRGETFSPSEAVTANALGLTTQVPVRTIYLTSGATRVLKLGNAVVELRHAPRWELLNGITGQVARALKWAGRQEVTLMVKVLGEKLTAEEKATVFAMRTALPAWMIVALGQWANG